MGDPRVTYNLDPDSMHMESKDTILRATLTTDSTDPILAKTLDLQLALYKGGILRVVINETDK